MKRIDIDSLAPALKKFFHGLPVEADGIEIALAGEVLCKIVPPFQLAEAAKAATAQRLHELLKKSRKRSERVPAATIEREIRTAVATVRKGR